MQVTHEDLVKRVAAATKEVFAVMLNSKAEPGESGRLPGGYGPSNGVAALVSITGPLVGTGVVWGDNDMACQLASAMLMTKFTVVDDEVLDVMGEIANMIIGNLKTSLEEDYGPLGLSVPNVICGENFATHRLGKRDWTVVPFRCSGGGQLSVQIFLEESAGLPRHARVPEAAVDEAR